MWLWQQQREGEREKRECVCACMHMRICITMYLSACLYLFPLRELNKFTPAQVKCCFYWNITREFCSFLFSIMHICMYIIYTWLVIAITINSAINQATSTEEKCYKLFQLPLHRHLFNKIHSAITSAITINVARTIFSLLLSLPSVALTEKGQWKRVTMWSFDLLEVTINLPCRTFFLKAKRISIG